MTKTGAAKDKSELTFNRQKVIRIFFFVTFGFVLYQLFLLARPFLTALLLAGMLALGFYPVFIPLRRGIRNGNLAAFLLTIGVFLAAVIPLAGLLWFLFKEADRLLPTVQAFLADVQNTDLQSWSNKVPSFIRPAVEPVLRFFDTLDVQPQERILRFAAVLGTKITTLGAFAAGHALIFFINIVVFLLALFFAFRDGELLYKWVLSLIPMDNEHKKALFRRAYETFMAVVLGVVVTAGAQGITAMLGFWVAGVKLPVLLGLFVMITAFFGASFLVTIPVAIVAFQSSVGWGIFLLIWGMVVVGLMDNVLKPVLIGSRARMPFVLIFFSIIGGVKAYGLLGFILGPIIVASFLTFVNIYRKGYDVPETEEEITAS